MKKTIIAILSAVIVLLGGYTALNFGSVTTGQEYQATTTAYYGMITSQQIKKGFGSLGSVTITTAGNLKFALYDATSTVVAHRPSYNKTTSSILLAEIPASLAVGTYTFDVEFIDGLYFDVVSGTSGTSTISYR